MATAEVSYTYAKRHGILIVEAKPDFVKAIYHPECNTDAIFELRRHFEVPLHLEAVTKEEFLSKITKLYEVKAEGASQLAEDIGENVDLQQFIQRMPKTQDLLESENDVPVIRLINALLREAIKKAASDIHFETFEEVLAVRFRIDGILQNVLEVPAALAPLVISRIKVMSKLDISEKRLPQDGRLSVKIAGREVNIRVSTIPVRHGERAVLRILDKQSVHLSLSELGISDELLSAVRRMIYKPHGIVLVTGPTGSGKTTSLYAMLTELNVPGRNIMTVEDPVEYDLQGIGQIQVNTKVEMSFARSLRAILRQDPNVIMIGEIRDLETAVIAVQASLTGHLVLSTLHTNTATGAIARLRDMGVESFLLSSSLVGVIAQRLVRLLCNRCKEAYIAIPEECESLGISVEINKTIYRAKGCQHCNQTGYSRRVGIYEIIELDNNLRRMIHENASEQELETYARKQSTSIWQNSAMRVLSGETSMEEIIRVTRE